MIAKKYSSVVFDFGGVLFPVEPYSGGDTTSDERRRITGAIQSINKDFGSDIAQGTFSIPKFRKEFTKHVDGLSTKRIRIVLQSICEPDLKVLRFLQQVHQHYSLFGLVNAPVGWTEIRRGLHHLDTYFQRIVVSHEINVRKPDPQLFEYFIETTRCRPSTTLFIDDKQENIDVADSLGFQTMLFHKPEELDQIIKT